jgi:hypothetical protein
MRFGNDEVRDRRLRMISGALAAGGLVACSAPAAPAKDLARMSTPPLLWSDVQQVGVYCLVTSPRGVEADLQSRICDRLRELASVGSPAPVRAIPIGDPAILHRGTVTMILQGTIHRTSGVAPGAAGEFIAFSVRPFRTGDEASFTGSAVHVARLDSGVESPALATALSAALAETLPWRAPAPFTARPIQ